jgi:hypothetical protein
MEFYYYWYSTIYIIYIAIAGYIYTSVYVNDKVRRFLICRELDTRHKKTEKLPTNITNVRTYGMVSIIYVNDEVRRFLICRELDTRHKKTEKYIKADVRTVPTYWGHSYWPR